MEELKHHIKMSELEQHCDCDENDTHIQLQPFTMTAVIREWKHILSLRCTKTCTLLQ